MSQEKVDQYKKEKANRKKTINKEKRLYKLEMGAVVVVLAAAIGWFGYSIYQSKQPEITVNIATDYTAVDNYLNGLTYE